MSKKEKFKKGNFKKVPKKIILNMNYMCFYLIPLWAGLTKHDILEFLVHKESEREREWEEMIIWKVNKRCITNNP